MCLEEEKPICVKWCLNDVLQFEEREVETDEEPATSEMETGLKSMIDEHGLQKVSDTFARMSKKG
jgi:benzoyl-CoA reductase subunit BamC